MNFVTDWSTISQMSSAMFISHQNWFHNDDRNRVLKSFHLWNFHTFKMTQLYHSLLCQTLPFNPHSLKELHPILPLFFYFLKKENCAPEMFPAFLFFFFSQIWDLNFYRKILVLDPCQPRPRNSRDPQLPPSSVSSSSSSSSSYPHSSTIKKTTFATCLITSTYSRSMWVQRDYNKRANVWKCASKSVRTKT